MFNGYLQNRYINFALWRISQQIWQFHCVFLTMVSVNPFMVLLFCRTQSAKQHCRYVGTHVCVLGDIQVKCRALVLSCILNSAHISWY